MKKKNIHSVGFVSLGCPKALVDTEPIVNLLVSNDIKITPSFQEADLVVVNTCGFIDSAVKESLDSIQEAKKKNGKVIVTGCLGAKKNLDGTPLITPEDIGVLEVTGPNNPRQTAELIKGQLNAKGQCDIEFRNKYWYNKYDIKIEWLVPYDLSEPKFKLVDDIKQFCEANYEVCQWHNKYGKNWYNNYLYVTSAEHEKVWPFLKINFDQFFIEHTTAL